MNMQNKYSDEFISAYIDGELDNEDRARLLFAEQEDGLLARRINEARMLKEKVQLAYLEYSKDKRQNRPFKCSVFINQHRPLVAGFVLLIGLTVLLLPYVYVSDDLSRAKQLMDSTQPLMAKSIADAVGKHSHVVIHVSQYQESKFGSVIDEIEALLHQHNADKSLSVEIVANKQGLKVLDADRSVFAHRLEQLTKRFDTLELVACARSLAQLASSGEPVNLLKSIITTPSAAQQVARRTAEGWVYIKV